MKEAEFRQWHWVGYKDGRRCTRGELLQFYGDSGFDRWACVRYCREHKINHWECEED